VQQKLPPKTAGDADGLQEGAEVVGRAAVLFIYNISELILLFSSSGEGSFMTVTLYRRSSFTCRPSRISYLGAMKCRKTQEKT